MKIKFKQEINFPLNFWIHLETACGSPTVYHSQLYENEVSFQIRKVKKEFLRIHQGYDFSLSIRKMASVCKTIEELAELLTEYNVEWKKILQSNEKYKVYWNSIALKELKIFINTINNNVNKLKDIALKVSKFTGIRSLPKNIKIYPIHSLSEKYGFGAQPIFPNGILLGVVNEKSVVLALTHEIIHLNTYNVFRNIFNYEKSKFEEDIIDEVLVNLTLNAMIRKGLLEPPVFNVVSSVETPEFKEFQRKFEELNSQILPLTKEILERRKTILDMKIKIEKIISK